VARGFVEISSPRVLPRPAAPRPEGVLTGWRSLGSNAALHLELSVSTLYQTTHEHKVHHKTLGVLFKHSNGERT